MISETKPNGEPWYVGDTAEVLNAITDPKTGNPVDPASLEVEVVKPDSTTSKLAPTKSGTGQDYLRVAFTLPGPWQLIWRSTGEYVGVATITIKVRKPRNP